MRIIAIANQKGGCGKTTTAVNLSACLASKGCNVLLIDMDPQGHSSLSFDLNGSELDKTVFDALSDLDGHISPPIDDIIHRCEGFDIAPSNLQLSLIEQQLSMVPGREFKLKKVINNIENNYDFIIIDCPPSLGLLTFNALIASTEIFIPIDMGYFSLHGTEKLLGLVDLIREKTGLMIRIKTIATMVDRRTRISKEVVENIKNNFQDAMFHTVINFNVRLKEAASHGNSILRYDAKSIGAKDYLGLADEVLNETHLIKPLHFRVPKALPLKEKKIVLYAPEAKTVRIAGSFNNWIPADDFKMEKKIDGTWVKIISLPPGEYQYKFFVDDKNWVEDKENPNTAISNPYGSKNSILVID